MEAQVFRAKRPGHGVLVYRAEIFRHCAETAIEAYKRRSSESPLGCYRRPKAALGRKKPLKAAAPS